MTSSEKILAGILEEAQRTANKIIKAAEADAENVINEAKAKAETEDKKIIDAAHKKAEIIISTGKSSAALLVRDAALKCRREKIDEALSLTVERLNKLPDAEYFDYIADIAEKYALQESGEILLSAKDLKRDTSLLTEKLTGKNIILSDKPADICGGFVLKYGDIEINADFKALIHEKREALVDCINKELFN